VIRPRVLEHERADPKRQREHRQVDDPIAHGAAASRLLEHGTGKQQALPARHDHLLLDRLDHPAESVRRCIGADPLPKSIPASTGDAGGRTPADRSFRP
jgi:hypothetical protein